MRAHYLQHVSFEGLGSIEPWLRKAGYEIGCTRHYESEALPSADSFDLLIVMGGPMSVNDETDHPWLIDEKRFIRYVIHTGRPVLGICLGAQQVARMKRSGIRGSSAIPGLRSAPSRLHAK